MALPLLCSLGSAGKVIYIYIAPVNSLSNTARSACAYQTIYAVRHIATASIKAETSFGIAVFSLSLAANTLSTGNCPSMNLNMTIPLT